MLLLRLWAVHASSRCSLKLGNQYARELDSVAILLPIDHTCECDRVDRLLCVNTLVGILEKP